MKRNFWVLLLMASLVAPAVLLAQTTPLSLIPRIESEATPDVRRLEPIKPAQIEVDIDGPTSDERVLETLGPNLIPNSSVEEASPEPSRPSLWRRGGYGNNTRTLTYPEAPAQHGSRAIKVGVSNYVSGDAKWYFDDVAVEAGSEYQYSDYSVSDVTSHITARYFRPGGTYLYVDLGTIAPSSNYQHNSVRFTVPPNVTSMTVFHLIKQNGSLITDNHSLNQVSTEGDNIVTNGTFEQQGGNGLPVGWAQGRWGTNQTTFIYPAPGVNGSRGAKVEMTSRSSGDAKWAMTPLTAGGGTYTYSGRYQSNTTTYLTVQYQTSAGFHYQDIAILGPSSDFAFVSREFTIPANAANFRVFHLINRVGALTIDDVSITQSSELPDIFQTGGVALVLDDGRISQWQNAVPKLNQTGLKATFYITSQQTGSNGFPGFFTHNQIQQLRQQGHEIGAHTRTHRALTALSPSEQEQEIAGSKQDLIDLGVGPIQTFAYPFGDYNQTTLNIVRNNFASARTSMGGNVNPNTDLHQMPRLAVNSNITFAQVRSWIDTAVANRELLILTFHDVHTTGGTYSTTPAIFNQIIDYLVAQDTPVVTISEAIE